ncbi:Mitochondrial Ribosomal Protein, Small [Aphelenchoides bicaudatus]|nr:Mitochondrial Ribosomal Protein, Small [Aphelenchoides bicaudatus]
MVRRHVWDAVMRQPFAVPLPGIWRSHPKFLTKTIMVENNDVDHAFQLLNKMMEREGLLKIIRDTVRFQKQYVQRHNMAMEASRAIIREDLNRKIKFLSRKNRVDAYPGQMTQ